MPLKVLLCDDSQAIKKVVQLSLQDFGVELRSVANGKEALEVAKKFAPDIALVDVLLPHKTGYEIAGEIKKDAALKKVPVIMLWSAFMAFDEGKFKASGAEAKLEKPFDVSGLRSAVTKLVPRLNTPHPISKHLEFPKLEWDEPIGAVPPKKKSAVPPPPPLPPLENHTGSAPTPVPTASPTSEASTGFLFGQTTVITKVEPPAPPTPTPVPPPASAPEASPAPKEEWTMASFEDIGTFTARLEKEKHPAKTTSPEAPIASANLGKFKVPIPQEGSDENTVSFQYNESQVMAAADFLLNPEAVTQIPHAKQGPASPKIAAPPPPKATEPTEHETLDQHEIDTMLEMNKKNQAALSQEIKEIVEKAVWKLVPDIATQIIREEIKRLLNDEES